jgi:hypothetical protein
MTVADVCRMTALEYDGWKLFFKREGEKHGNT